MLCRSRAGASFFPGPMNSRGTAGGQSMLLCSGTVKVEGPAVGSVAKAALRPVLTAAGSANAPADRVFLASCIDCAVNLTCKKDCASSSVCQSDQLVTMNQMQNHSSKSIHVQPDACVCSLQHSDTAGSTCMHSHGATAW